jgi:tetratricopeptide (TPR) repeat protein
MAPIKDKRIPFSTQRPGSLDRYDRALHLFHGYYGDPLAVIDEALADDPGFVSGLCLRAGLLLTASDARLEPELRQTVETAERLLPESNRRERMHVAAARAWADRDFRRSVDLYGRVLLEYPTDGLAVQVAHLGDYYLGDSAMLRDRIARVLPHWDKDHPAYGFVLGMHAFGLEETNLLDRAEETGRRALELNRQDPWAVHAVAHVMEMTGRLEDGVEWMTSRVDDWAPDNAFAPHNWWHLALYHLDLGQVGRALELYDRKIWPSGADVILDLIDASSKLWRLHLRGVDVGDRWQRLADVWEQRVDEAYYAFNDAHAMMALTASGRDAAAVRLVRVLEAKAEGTDTNAAMVREVGLPVCRAIRAFGRGDYTNCAATLLQIRGVANRFGGSNAQRDFIDLTLVEAALRSGNAALAEALANERTALKPHSPFNWELVARAKTIRDGKRHWTDDQERERP